GTEAAPANVTAAGQPAVVGLSVQVAPEDAGLAEVELALEPAQLQWLAADPEAGVHQGGGADDLRVGRLAPRGPEQVQPPRGALQALEEGLEEAEVHRPRHRDVHRALLQVAGGAELGLRPLEPEPVAAHPSAAEAHVPRPIAL